MHPPVSDTSKLRNQIRLRRSELGAAEIESASVTAASRLLATAAYLRATRVSAYVAANNELDPRPIVKEAWNSGKHVYLPVIQEDNGLSFAPYHPHSTLQKNRYRILEPVCPEEELLSAADLDLILVPLVAFDPGCRRIGMGAGYYDRTLSGLRPDYPVKAGLAYDFQRVEHIEAQSWDIPMDMIVTEQRLYLKTRTGDPA